MFKLGVLDQTPTTSNGSPKQAIEDSITLAQAVEALDYDSYWTTEHHGFRAAMCSQPELLLAIIGSKTTRIKIGSGAALLLHNSAIRILENYSMLQTLYPDRILLGIGRGAGITSELEHFIEVPEFMPGGIHTLFDDRLEKILDVVSGRANIYITPPIQDNFPPITVMGSGSNGAEWAARYGLPFNFAHFVNKKNIHDIIKTYRKKFKPSQFCDKPTVSMAINAFCSDSEQQARELSLPNFIFHLMLQKGENPEYSSIQDALSYPLNDKQQKYLKLYYDKNFVGTAKHVSQKLKDLAKEFDLDEILINTAGGDLQQRIHSYELIAKRLLD